MGGNLGSDFRMPQKPSGLGGLLPQQNLDFLSRLPKNMMPNLDFSNLPQNMKSLGTQLEDLLWEGLLILADKF
jgi:hypothetical protein